MTHKSWKSVTCCSAAVVAMLLADGAHAQQRSFNLPEQEATKSLPEFARQAGIQIAAPTEQLKGMRTPELKGEFDVREALEQLLQGTGLTVASDENGMIVLQKTSSTQGNAQTSSLRAKGEEMEARLARATGEQGEERKNSVSSQEETKPTQPEELTVTASRVARTGYTAPTPTTVLGQDDLKLGGATDIGQALFQLPSMRPTLSPAVLTASIYGGFATADLRGLGAFRTLVLVDGKRQTPTSVQAYNLNQIPFSLVKRVEVVTGGASAAWGSDAVAGVVNIILDNELNGFHADVQHGFSSRDDGEETNASLAYGVRFASDRGHFMVGAEYVDNAGVAPRTARDYYGKWALVANPAFTPTNGQPQQIIASNVNFSVATLGGLITSGPLAGTQFLDGGTTAPFQYGALRGATFMVGGDPNAVQNDDYLGLIAPVKRGNAYVRTTFDVTDNIKLTTDLLWAGSKSQTDFAPQNHLGNIVIRSDNAFLPASVRDQMSALGITQFNLGRLDQDVGGPLNSPEYDTRQGTIGLSGGLGEQWRWDAYYSRGHGEFEDVLSNLQITSRFNSAIDTVLDAAGQPVCRSTLADPANGCVPFNPFGPDASSAAARRYVTGTARQHTDLDFDVAAVTLRGEPFGTWAGRISIAAGIEWRRQKVDLAVDPLSAARSFTLINFAPLQGSVNVKEGFAEAVIPLAANLPLMKSLELNGAVRVSDYNFSGSITSWKAGLSYQLNDQLRLRGTRSRDIRAPNLTELFTQRVTGVVTILDPSNNVQSVVNQFNRGDTGLAPERADTNTVGLIYQPAWLGNLRLSVDYYDIDVSGAITTLSAQDIVTRCSRGEQALCPLIERNGAGVVTVVDAPYLNLSSFKTSGFDIELGYATPAPFGGTLDTRLLANNVRKLVSSNGATRVDLLGNLGANITGVPEWRFVASADYQVRNLGIKVRARYIGSGNYNRTLSIDDNTVESTLYFDLGAEYRLGSRVDNGAVIYVNVANLLDESPPRLPNAQIYDLMGRYYTLGIRVSY